MSARKVIATAEFAGTYGKERAEVYVQNGVTRCYAPGWRPMRFADAIVACRKVASHSNFIKFCES